MKNKSYGQNSVPKSVCITILAEIRSLKKNRFKKVMIRVELITPHTISITIYKHERSLFNCLFHQGYLILFEELILWVYSASTGALCVKILFMKNDSINTFCRNWSDITNFVHNPSMYLSSWVWMLQYSKTAQACTISIKKQQQPKQPLL